MGLILFWGWDTEWIAIIGEEEFKGREVPSWLALSKKFYEI